MIWHRSRFAFLPPVVVLDTAYAGYGVLRSLYPYGIPIIGFCSSRSMPESHTNLCFRKIYYRDETDLILKLTELPQSLKIKPVLILTTDFYVEFFLRNRARLEHIYQILMPPDDLVNMLLDKNKFSEYAKNNNILIPKSFEVRSATDLKDLKDSGKFPVILKPFKRTPEWEHAGCKKAYVLEGFDALESFYEQISKIEKEVIIQEYIEGNDDQVEYCLTYFSSDHTCIASFTGQKLRQWPVGTGSTATTVPTQNGFLAAETIRLFQSVGYIGFGSVEYKRDRKDGRYFLMEPTVGRLNQQEYVATLSGFNIPLAAYCDLTGVKINPTETIRTNVVYIDELAEIQSVYIHIKNKLITVTGWLRSLRGKRYYRYFNVSDPAVFFIGLPAKTILKLTRYLFSKPTS